MAAGDWREDARCDTGDEGGRGSVSVRSAGSEVGLGRDANPAGRVVSFSAASPAFTRVIDSEAHPVFTVHIEYPAKPVFTVVTESPTKPG